MNWGANAIYAIEDGSLEFRSLYKLPAPQSDMENCVAHNGSIIPVPGRDIFVQAWDQGGISGLDIFALEPSEFLTREEIAAAEAARYEGNLFNPQTQTQVTWPDEVVEAAVASRRGG